MKLVGPQDEPKAKPLSSVSEESDKDLLCLMGWADDYPAEARAAFEEFYRRHAEVVYAACVRAYGHDLTREYSVTDLVVDTFARAREKGGTYDTGGLTDAAALERRTEGWLIRIAHSIAVDVYRNLSPAEKQLSDEAWEWVAEWVADTPKPTDSPEVQLVREALWQVLDDREREVLLVTFHWYRPDRENQRLPNKIAAEVAARLGITTENLRKIRAKALAKVKAYVLAHRPNMPAKGYANAKPSREQ